jgi:hypothetical protein
MPAPITLVVRAGRHDRLYCPVSARIPVPAGAPITLQNAESGEPVVSQARLTAEGVELAWILPRLERGRELHFRVLVGEQSASGAPYGVTIHERPGHVLDVAIGGRLVTSYHFGPELARAFLHPLIGPDGAPVTRAFPMLDLPGERKDHPHHRSVWVAHGDVNGVDDWSEGPGHGRIVHRSFLALSGGPVWGEIAEINDWVANTGEPVMREERRWTIYGLPDDVRMIDLQSTYQAAYGPVTFGDTKEGGLLSVRVATSMDARGEGQIENAVGSIGEKETWGKRAHWCDYAGPVQGRWVGITIMDHPENPHHPTYWHVRDYGLMTANPFGLSFYRPGRGERGDWTIPAGEQRTFRYRLYVHRGDAAAGQVAARYQDYINPPEVVVE